MDGPCTAPSTEENTMSNRNSFGHFFDQAVRQAADTEIRRREHEYQMDRVRENAEYERLSREYDAEHCLGDYAYNGDG